MYYVDQGPDFLCVVQTCAIRAAVRVNVGTRTEPIWQHMCGDHYDEYHATRARRWCADRGLKTVEQQRAFIRQTLKNGKIGKGGVRAREPGEDEDFILGSQP